MVVLPGSGSGWVSILGMLRLLFHPTGMCKMPGQGVLVGLAKSLEKLSSGFRINRAADDAAGLAISEGLRTQVGGNRQAVRNAQDGISLVQTAEGALNEVHSILQRMRVLAVQGATDSNSPDARRNINTELSQLRDELQRIGSVTNFNGTSLLNGKASGNDALKFQVGANGNADNRIVVDLRDADVTAVAKFSGIKKVTSATELTAGAAFDKGKYALELDGKVLNLDFSAAKPANEKEVQKKLAEALKASGIEGYVGGTTNVAASGAVTDFDKAVLDGKTFTLKVGEHEISVDAKTLADGTHQGATPQRLVDVFNQELGKKGLNYTMSYGDADGFKITANDSESAQVTVKLTTDASGIKVGGKDTTTLLDDRVGKPKGAGYALEVGNDLTLHIKRADGGRIDKIGAHNLTKLGATANTGDTDVAFTATGETADVATDYNYLTVDSHDAAQNLINVLDAKIQSVSTARANLGAVQNRFEHTITNLNVAVENLAASESRVRDTDMAQEMMQFTRNQILSQAGTSMLAQANQVPQGVLSLLR
ncbi:bacterial flagellin domain protein [Mobiluncus mulieris 28-1]|uniref:flagellin N-terminal helical domain-containing protein n=1 Tax=Mobiluncus mulieris TaxID=2052 RepID=UPI0001BE7A51|nr:flagellin [Mobiluncus mulieris]EEZ91996.1 bacterial flagellin domain protein [Mobiluncus mulieris 28-1]